MGICIDGRHIAEEILTTLREHVKKSHLSPHIEVILIGDNPSSLSYIKQKQKAAESIGATLHLTQFEPTVTKEELKNTISTFNTAHNVSGIIIQRPIPVQSTIPPDIISSIAPEKDVDGFVPHTIHEVPVAKGVISILEYIFYKQFNTPQLDFPTWLRGQHVVVLGKGETAGKPIIEILEKFSVPVIIIDRSTPNPHELTKEATIIITCVGVPGLISRNHIQDQVILLSVGLSRVDGKLIGDYDVEDIQDKASFYTPTPGGVGPVNVACLMQNLVKAAEQ